MQDYMAKIDCKCLLYADIAHQSVGKKFNKAFNDAPDIVVRMKDSCKKKSTIIMIGLWLLDFVLYNNWQKSTHPMKSFPEYIVMACIERDIVEGYHASMFKDCAASVYIQMALASTLTEACKVKAWEVLSQTLSQMFSQTFTKVGRSLETEIRSTATYFSLS